VNDEHGQASDDPVAEPDVTLGGYIDTHDRPPAFEGPDGNPYTVSVEVEKTPDLAAPYAGYLVFPKWAGSGVGIVGHVETPLLLHTRSEADTRTGLLALPLVEVKALLDRAVSGDLD
jgi:hypothetical protein